MAFNIDISNLTVEQKVVLRLAEMGFLTSSGDIQRALDEFQYANYMISPIEDDGSLYPTIDKDDDGVPDKTTPEENIENATGVECENACDHESLTNEEIQTVFDNDYESLSNSEIDNIFKN